MDSVGVVSLVWEVSKDLYIYYRAIKEHDRDIDELRAQLLALQGSSQAVLTTLNRDGAKVEDYSEVHKALSRCSQASIRLRIAFEKATSKDTESQKLSDKLRSLREKAIYPLKKETITSLVEDIKTCQDALRLAIALLGTNISISTVEQLHNIDDKLVDVVDKATLESALKDLKLTDDKVGRQLQLQTNLLDDEVQRKKAKAIVKSLAYPEQQSRWNDIADVDNDTFDWIFAPADQQSPRDHSPQIDSLLSFLHSESGLFWIQGKPASGKSTFVKYVVNHMPDWSGGKDVIYAGHCFWVAGTSLQRSQQGLLQSLLRQVLSSDLTLVPHVCPARWGFSSGHRPWSIKELWKCLFAAVELQKRPIVFFIDGLDENQPEREHRKLAESLKELSLYNQVRVLVSSRPWDVFQNVLSAAGQVLSMQSITSLAIVNYVRDRLDGSAQDDTFANVHWDSLGHVDDKLTHGGVAHELVVDILRKADGMFLWVELIMDAICRRLATLCTFAVLRKQLDDMPDELEHYLRQMVLDRIHKDWLSETAMALQIALVGDGNLRSYCLLVEQNESGKSLLCDPDFIAMPYRVYNASEASRVIQRTYGLLQNCCRDILRLPGLFDAGRLVSPYGGIEPRDEVKVTFLHRTMFDFLKTPEMRILLEDYVPEHFTDQIFPARLAIAQWKLGLSDEQLLASAYRCWRSLCEPLVDSLDGNNPLPLDVVRECELVGVHYFNTIATPEHESLESIGYRSLTDLQRLFILLAKHDFCGLTTAIARTKPEILCVSSISPPLLDSLRGRVGLKFGQVWTSARVELVQLQLENGADPNEIYAIGSMSTTPWRGFLALLNKIEDDTTGEKLKESHQEGRPGSIGPKASHEHFWGVESFLSSASTANIRSMIEMMLKFGADLEVGPPDLKEQPGICLADPLKYLKSRLPVRDESVEWHAMLDAHATPEKRKELALAQQRRTEKLVGPRTKGSEKCPDTCGGRREIPS